MSDDLFADGREHRLHPSTVIVDRITALATLLSIATVLFIVVTVVTFVMPLTGWLPVALYSAHGVMVVTLGTLAWVMPRLAYRHARYRVDDIGFTVRRGVLWRSLTSVPRSRVQHTDVSQGPLQRRHGIATLVIHTAGTQDASVAVAGLPHDIAMRIRDHLIVGGGDDGV